MPIPDYQSCMLPLLTLASDGKEHRLSDAIGGEGTLRSPTGGETS